MLKSGIPWEMLPQELGCGSGVTCWRRLRDWQQAGVWERLHRVLLDQLGTADQIDWGRASLDSATVPAKGERGDRPESDGTGQPGSQCQVVVDRNGTPLAITLTAAIVHGAVVFADMVAAIPPIKRPRGRPRKRRSRCPPTWAPPNGAAGSICTAWATVASLGAAARRGSAWGGIAG